MVIKYEKIVDLSLRLHNNMATYPGDPPISIRPLSFMPEDKMNMLGIDMSVHHGTHIDVPLHQMAGGASLDQYPPSMFVKNTMRLDLVPEVAGPGVTQKGGIYYRQVVTFDDLAPHVEQLRWVEAVVIHTDYGKVLLKDKVDEDYPYLDVKAAEMLARFNNIKLVGIDSLSVDAMGENKVHQILFGNGERALVESLVCLDMIPLSFTLCCFPLRIANSDGAPCRAVAFC